MALNRRPQAAALRTDHRKDEVGGGCVPVRVAIVFATLAFVLEVGSAVFYAAAAGSSSGLSVPPTTLLASGPTGAGLIRWGSIVDMFGYLGIPPSSCTSGIVTPAPN